MNLHVSDMVKNMSNLNDFESNSDPLFSCISTLYILILLYFPQKLKHSFSPVILITALSLLCLVRLGAKQRLKTHKDEEVINASEEKEEGSYDEEESCVLFDESVSNPGFEFDQYFIGWNVKAPLEVIYEAYEGEEEDEDDHSNGNESMHEKDYDHGFELNIGFGLERFNSLSKYYPETDSDCSSDRDFPVRAFCWDSPESVCFEWEEEDREDSLIEIGLDHYVKKDSWSGIHFEEENLIEIDISHKKYGI